MESQDQVLNAIADYDEMIMREHYEQDINEEDTYNKFLQEWEMNGLFDDIFGG